MNRYAPYRHKAVEYLGDNRGLFECPKGHRRKLRVISKGPLRSRTDSAARIVFGWWQRGGGVQMGGCPACEQAEKK
jgi:hypothetical protein